MGGEMMYGDQALAAGALAAGVQFVTCYPGTPGSNTAVLLAQAAAEAGIYFEWSVNERVALETAIGASLAGRRSLVCVKSVGMNVLVDPLMVLNLSGVHAGMVILLGDDPGAYGSQNDQDTRWIARLAELPLLEPDTPAAAFSLMQDAFRLSEQFRMAVILRVTRSFIQLQGHVDISQPTERPAALGWVEDRDRFFPYPKNAVELHAGLHKKLAAFGQEMEGYWLNRVFGSGRFGILAAGVCVQKLRDLGVQGKVGVPSTFELGSLYPLPKKELSSFLAGLEDVLVLEENDSFVESQVKALAQESRLSLRVFGRDSGHIPPAGELFRWQIQGALGRVAPGLRMGKAFPASGESDERPQRESHCNPDFYLDLFDRIERAGKDSGQAPAVIVDPGCQVALVGRADAKFAIGSAVAVADGIKKAGLERPAVAIFGDSAFFHSALPAICNAAVGGSQVFMIVVDNRGALTTGRQPSPNTGLDAQGRTVRRLDIVEIARACGVDYASSLPETASWDEIGEAVLHGLNQKGLALLVIRKM